VLSRGANSPEEPVFRLCLGDVTRFQPEQASFCTGFYYRLAHHFSGFEMHEQIDLVNP
jgi:hypothetical protein